MTAYQRQSEAPRYGVSEQELRVRGLLQKLKLPFKTDSVYCFRCRRYFVNGTAYKYPTVCLNCTLAFDDVGQYCMPDIIMEDNSEHAAILYINGGIHDKNKVIKKDRSQITELRHDGHLVFVLKNDEIDNMTNATLKGYLLAAYTALGNHAIWYQMYKDEKEYACLA